MLIGLTELKTYHMFTTDGEIGRLVDVVFPQGSWPIRYIIAWSDGLGREIALPSSGVREVRRDDRLIQVDAEQGRVEASPALDVTRRIERHEEEQLYEHYGWPPYWLQEEHDVTPIGVLSDESEELRPADEGEFANPELQRATECVGAYAVHSNEGEFGVLQDVVLEDSTWTITWLAVDTPSRRSGILVETGWVERVDWIAKEIYVSLAADVLLDGPVYRSHEPLTPELERRLHAYYDRISRVT